MPSPQPSPTGEGAGCSRFRRCRSSEKECPKHQRQEFFRQPLSQGRWNKRRERFFRRPLNPSVGCAPQGTHAVGWGCRENGERVRACVPHTPYIWATACLTPTATPSSLPWERVRERATSRKACIGAVRVLGKIAAIWRMPSPQPSPTGEGAGWSRFKRCRSSEKECPKHQWREFFR